MPATPRVVWGTLHVVSLGRLGRAATTHLASDKGPAGALVARLCPRHLLCASGSSLPSRHRVPNSRVASCCACVCRLPPAVGRVGLAEPPAHPLSWRLSVRPFRPASGPGLLPRPVHHLTSPTPALSRRFPYLAGRLVVWHTCQPGRMTSLSAHRVSYYYDTDVGNFYYAQGHPMKPYRVRMTHNLLLSYGMLDRMDILVRYSSCWMSGLRGRRCRGEFVVPGGVSCDSHLTRLCGRTWPRLLPLRYVYPIALLPPFCRVCVCVCYVSRLCFSCASLQTPPRASERDMTRFHADEYINFLKTVTPEVAQEGQPFLRRCTCGVLHWLASFRRRGLGSCIFLAYFSFFWLSVLVAYCRGPLTAEMQFLGCVKERVLGPAWSATR